MVIFDATLLSLLFHPTAKAPLDSNGNAIDRCQERIEHLVANLTESKTKIIIPTPALSELLVIAGPDGSQYLDKINTYSCFKISDFDQRAAIEAAMQIREAIKSGDKRYGTGSNWAKVKFDRQIVAIAKVEAIETVYSDDEDVQKYAMALGMEAKGVESLDLPPPKQPLLEGLNEENEKD